MEQCPMTIGKYLHVISNDTDLHLCLSYFVTGVSGVRALSTAYELIWLSLQPLEYKLCGRDPVSSTKIKFIPALIYI